MKYLFLFWLFVIAVASEEQRCDVVVIRGDKYEKQVLKTDVHAPYQLAMDYQTKTLFFSLSAEVGGKTVLKSAYFNLRTNEYGEISGINGGMANAVDSLKHTVYLGGKDGIYEYDFTTKKAKNLGITDSSIWQMFFCPVHGLFFTTYKPDEKSFVYHDEQVQPVAGLTDTRTRLIAVGEHHDIFFANSSGLFIYNMHTNVFINLGDYNVNGFARDVNGKLYFSCPNGIFFPNDIQKKIEPLVLVRDNSIYGVTFDGDNNMIYASEDSIVRLVPTTKTC
uniref:Diapause associated protein 2 n=1 Tax=Antheraea pernyi TaxID=7119 RepID=H9BE66_ANTPE|nr:diapause associated protein 2 [Antheraea pernyi]